MMINMLPRIIHGVTADTAGMASSLLMVVGLEAMGIDQSAGSRVIAPGTGMSAPDLVRMCLVGKKCADI